MRGFTESLRQELDLSEGCVSATCVHPGIKTNIALAARFNDSGGEILGKNTELTRQAFNDNMLRTSAEKAAGSFCVVWNATADGSSSASMRAWRILSSACCLPLINA